MTIPILSMRALPAPDFAAALGASFRRYGFAMVSDHGMDEGLVARGWAEARAFFALPEEEKRRYIVPGGAGQRGYTAFGVETAKGAAASDLKEFWHVGRDLPPGSPLAGTMPPNVWPEQLQNFAPTFRALFAAFDVDAHAWVNERVGTIHTVQGREADAVMLVLGAPKPAQSRARIWAAETPNVFNVALSRARQSFYVVGSHDAWSGVAHGQDLAALPCERVTMSPDVRPGETQPEQHHEFERPSPELRSPQHRRGPTL